MNRYEFLESLDRMLSSLPYSERKEIMYDYEEHFNEGLKEGKTEEEIIVSLGAPDKIAGQYATVIVPVVPDINQNNNRTNENTTKQTIPPQPARKTGNGIAEIVALTAVMLFFNCIFIGFYIAFWGMLIAFVATGASLVIGGFAVLISAIIATPIAFLTIPAVFFQYPALLFIGSVILISLGGLMLIAMFYTIKVTAILTVRYVKWTIKLIRGF